jgi:phosphate starvation-inducible protein PhoH and related proteins
MSTSKKARSSNNGEIRINGFEPIVARNYAQGMYLDSIRRNQITFAVGPAGTGKSYIATAYAAEQLYYKKIDKLIITRPAVEAEESLGFLPGELEDKYAPYLAPIRDILDKLLGKSFVEYCLKVGYIEAVPIAHMRGRTFENAICLIDEAQNTTPNQMKLILSRIGEDCKFIVDGDVSQKDIKVYSGLEDAIDRLGSIHGVETIRFLTNDIVRSGMCKKIIQAYSEE